MNFNDWFYSAAHRKKYDNTSPAYLAAQEAWYFVVDECWLACERIWDCLPSPENQGAAKCQEYISETFTRIEQ